jgi:hypothetical protein
LEYRLQNLPVNGEQGPVPEEMSQTLLTNKKQGKIRPRDTTNIIKLSQLSINLKKYFYFDIKPEALLKTSLI